MATVIGKIDCPARCGQGQAEVREGKGGTLTIFHKGCCQAFVKSPTSVTALRAFLAGEGPKPQLPAAQPLKEEKSDAAKPAAGSKWFF